MVGHLCCASLAQRADDGNSLMVRCWCVDFGLCFISVRPVSAGLDNEQEITYKNNMLKIWHEACF